MMNIWTAASVITHHITSINPVEPAPGHSISDLKVLSVLMVGERRPFIILHGLLDPTFHCLWVLLFILLFVSRLFKSHMM